VQNQDKNIEKLKMKAIAICFKPFLKPEEACIYLNIGSTQLRKLCDNMQVFKTDGGYYRKEDLDKVAQGFQGNKITAAAADIKLSVRNRRS
jgi:hypothetical protein